MKMHNWTARDGHPHCTDCGDPMFGEGRRSLYCSGVAPQPVVRLAWWARLLMWWGS